MCNPRVPSCYKAELASPVLRGTAGLTTVFDVVKAIKRHSPSVNKSTGLHVHVRGLRSCVFEATAGSPNTCPCCLPECIAGCSDVLHRRAAAVLALLRQPLPLHLAALLQTVNGGCSQLHSPVTLALGVHLPVLHGRLASRVAGSCHS